MGHNKSDARVLSASLATLFALLSILIFKSKRRTAHRTTAADGAQVTERDLTLHRLEWTDTEVARCINYEWRVISFFNAFFVAAFFLLVDSDRRRAMEFVPHWTQVGGLWVLFLLVLYHASHVHRRLNERRLERHELYQKVGLDPWGDFSPGPLRLWEGWSALPFWSLVAILFMLTLLDMFLILNGTPAAFPASPTPWCV